MHLALAKMVYEGVKDLGIDQTQFYIGNILPDEAGDKTASHFRVPCSVSSYKLPQMDLVKGELFNIGDPIKLGAYCHLYFDYHFFEDYAFGLFIWDEEKETVTNKKNGLCWPTKEFWTHRVFYTAYGEFNHPIINAGLVDLDDIFKMPEPLPLIGYSRFDSRREYTWKKELIYFIEHELTYTGRIMEYEPCIEVLKKIANDLIKEIKAVAQ